MAEAPTHWHCGCLIGAGGHQTRAEAQACYNAQRAPARTEAALQSYMDPVQGLHPADGLPKPGCDCSGCFAARRRLHPWDVV